ncbi:hypothetical protein [Enterococcus faecalis]|nr:hypothetical protein [Enterococcus faecalis]
MWDNICNFVLMFFKVIGIFFIEILTAIICYEYLKKKGRREKREKDK